MNNTREQLKKNNKNCHVITITKQGKLYQQILIQQNVKLILMNILITKKYLMDN